MAKGSGFISGASGSNVLTINDRSPDSSGDIELRAVNIPTQPIDGMSASDVQMAIEEIDSRLRSGNIRSGGTITLTVAGWTTITNGFQQIVTLSGVTADDRAEIDPVFPSGQYITAPIETSTATNQIINKTTKKPTGAISGQVWLWVVG